MKKGISLLLLGLTIAFICFSAGLLVGRSIHKKPVSVQVAYLSTEEQTTDTYEDDSKSQEQKININTASENLLDTLPGIGPVLAKRIVEYRQTHGPFRQTTDLSQVEGIGSEKLLSILDLITVED